MKKTFLLLLIAGFTLASCIDKKNTEEEKPVIEILAPAPCDTLHFGSSFLFSIKVTDNSGLGNVSMDLHNNFGHHNHGDHETCVMDAVKKPINPHENNWFFSLPSDSVSYVFDTLLTLPRMKNDTTQFDTGDYHFHIYATDQDGYQSFTSLDNKLLY